ncbi:hypothetical protein Poli38472_003498 [Pythium oligandrum]|uniref:EF-hand domain-containing protein n=1 Tax=Pythium oligandrum TaxID=41045 RepID=A0A8K1C6Z1_PYTOL|nr:hypothetical protein Poli38472_003498 [Pythium oligandrum]|eukprot:TMW57573.1 hypothetical protein Poli38472_003498 [Pythium oligandrum]
MGVGPSTSAALQWRDGDEIELLRETREFARWSLSDVTQLYRRFQKTYGLAITEPHFEDLLLQNAPESVSIKEIFRALDTNKDGRIDGLEFLAALLCVCRASFEEKARFAFELFDFNANGSLSLTELALLMKSVWVGMCLLTGHSHASSSSVTTFLQLAQHAFERYDRDGGAALQYEEFIEWARSNRAFMLQIEHFRLIAEKAVGFEETLSLPDGSDVDSDLELEGPVEPSGRAASSSFSPITPALPPSWLIEPSDVSPPTPTMFPPPVNLELEWIYGYTSRVRDSVRFLASGDLVYVVAHYAIVYTASCHRQRVYAQHRAPITCLDVNSTQTVVATGDRASVIHIWHAATLECLAVLASFHVDGVACLAFPAAKSPQMTAPLPGGVASASGVGTTAKKQLHAADTLLVSIGRDENASMALWDWHHERLVASGRAVHKRKRVLSVAVSADGREILVVGEHFAVFHHMDGRFFKLKKPSGLEPLLKTMPMCVSATYMGPSLAVVGTARGELLLFQNQQLTRVTVAHDVDLSVSVAFLAYRAMVLFTAGKDGVVKQWDTTLQPIGTPLALHTTLQTLRGLEDEDFRVHSMAYDATHQQLVIGTRQGHLLLVHEGRDASEPPRVLASSHREGVGVEALACSRFGAVFATSSASDRCLRFWNMRKRVQDAAFKLTFAPSAVVFSMDGDYVAIGGVEGSVALLQGKQRLLVHQMRNTDVMVTCLRFHPSMTSVLLAVGRANGLVYLYTLDTQRRFHRHALLKPFSRLETSLEDDLQADVSVRALDFSVDGRFLRSQHGGKTLRFWRLESLDVTRVTTLASIRNVLWQTQSCTLGWHVNGIDDPETTALRANAARTMLATLEHDGSVHLRAFPCADSGDLTRSVAQVHQTGPQRGQIGFARHDTLLLTSKGDDGSVVCQWALVPEQPDPQPRAHIDKDGIWSRLSALGADFEDEFDFDNPCERSISDLPASHSAAAALSVSQAPLGRSEAPDLDLALSYVLGFNHRECGLNQILTLQGQHHTAIVYAAGTLLTTHHLQQRKQLRVVVSGLSHKITSLVAHSTNIFAVAARHGDGKVLLWRWEPHPEPIATLQAPDSRWKHVLTAFDETQTVSATAVTPTKPRELAAVVWKRVAKTQTYALTIYDTHKPQYCLAQTEMTQLPVLFGAFDESDDAQIARFVAGGVDHVVFYRVHLATGQISSQNGVFGRHALVETALCGVSLTPFVVTGMASGVLVLWDHSVAAFTLPLATSDRKENGKSAVVTLAAVESRHLLVAALHHGAIVLLSYATESDRRQTRAHSFFQVLRQFYLTDITGPPPTFSAENTMIRTVSVLEELHGGILVVLSDGVVLHVDGHALRSDKTSEKPSARLVLNNGSGISSSALHPKEALVALGYENGYVRVFNMESHAMIREMTPEAGFGGVKALAYDSVGRLAASFSDGNIALLDEVSLKRLTTFPCGDAKASSLRKWCFILRFSPREDPMWLAAACRDYNIYVYRGTVGETPSFELTHTFIGHTAPIRALDFSLDSRWLQSSTDPRDRQLLRWRLQADETEKEPPGDTHWYSWRNAFAGPTAGLLETTFGPTVTCVDRIHGLFEPDAWYSPLPTLVIGTDTGDVVLGWYPLPCGAAQRAMFQEYRGYYPRNSLIRDVRFSNANHFVMTRDLSGICLVWRTDIEDELRILKRTESTAVLDVPKTESRPPETPLTSLDTLLSMKKDQEDVGDETLSVQPWRGAIREPSIVNVKATAEVPTADLVLDFVYGVNRNVLYPMRHDVLYADDTFEIVYAAASFGVVFNTKTKTQLMNASHQGQLITCVAVHPRGDVVVTGELAPNLKTQPRLLAWDANSGSTITQIPAIHVKGIATLAFAPSGERLAAIGLGDDHLLALYSLTQGHGVRVFTLLAHMKTSKEHVYTLCFHLENDQELVTGGKHHVLFWTTAASGSGSTHTTQTLSVKKGVFNGGKSGASPHAVVLRAVYVQAALHAVVVVTAQQDGSLYVWKARQCVDVKRHAHTGPVNALVTDPKRANLFYSGGHDGLIQVWNAQLECLAQLDVKKLAESATLPLVSGILTSLAVRDDRILFATDGGDIAELVPEAHEGARAPHHAGMDLRALTTEAMRLNIHLRSHCKGELWGLAVHPTTLQFVTAGDDSTVRLWDAPSREMLALYRAKTTAKYRAAAFSTDGNHVVVGTQDGQVTVLLAEKLASVVTTWKCSARPIAVLRFDPENTFLAIGAHDQTIYLYDAHTYKPKGVCRGHSGTVAHLDFSKGGTVLQSTSNAGELLFWQIVKTPERETNAFQQIKAATSVRDTVWASWSLPYGWPVQGIWPSGSDGSDVNAVARSGDHAVVCTGDDFGQVKLFSYPCVASGAPAKTFVGHASHVTNCCFSRHDRFVLTTGGLDNALCQFRYVAMPVGATKET